MMIVLQKHTFSCSPSKHAQGDHSEKLSLWNAKKPVMTIKSMAAGRCTPFVGLTFNYATIRPCDMVTVGAFSAAEVHEDVEIAMAALERRRPILGRRSSPVPTSLTVARK